MFSTAPFRARVLKHSQEVIDQSCLLAVDAHCAESLDSLEARFHLIQAQVAQLEALLSYQRCAAGSEMPDTPLSYPEARAKARSCITSVQSFLKED
ncbi:MAG: hypothetical protein MUC92_07315 [Fimbriimonadaceae bacterium]|nr:hypothetical protein [Fimbriimonadaceae bacterium]